MAGTVFRSRPETRNNGQRASAPRELRIDYSLCCSCGACVAVCPPDALFLQGLTLTVDQAACTACERCVPACPVRALSLISKTEFYEDRL